MQTRPADLMAVWKWVLVGLSQLTHITSGTCGDWRRDVAADSGAGLIKKLFGVYLQQSQIAAARRDTRTAFSFMWGNETEWIFFEKTLTCLSYPALLTLQNSTRDGFVLSLQFQILWKIPLVLSCPLAAEYTRTVYILYILNKRHVYVLFS